VNRVAGSFGWPFRGHWVGRWAIGMALLVLLPLTFVLVLGYAVEAVRGSELAPFEGPPSWRSIARISRYGAWMSIALAIISAPFAVAVIFLAGALHQPALWRSTGTLLDAEAGIAALLIAALPWGLLLLVLMPHATDRYAVTQRARDLFDFAASVRSVRRDFATWNLVIATIVTAWAIGISAAALFCVGLVPGVFYAILVSAHATASLHPESSDPAAR
jgi:hypothetical protein